VLLKICFPSHHITGRSIQILTDTQIVVFLELRHSNPTSSAWDIGSQKEYFSLP
jgi:hypothetical protein